VSDTSLVTAREPRTGFGRISLRTLVPIRWVAITGQALTVLTVHYGLGYRLPLLPALVVVASSALLNILLILLRQVAARLGERDAALCLGYDILQLGLLLYLTGGLHNPFSILILAPVTVADNGSMAWASTRVRISKVNGNGGLILFAGGLRELENEHR